MYVYIYSWLVGLVGEGMRFVRNERTSRRVLQHDVAYLSNAQRQSVRGTWGIEETVEQ